MKGVHVTRLPDSTTEWIDGAKIAAAVIGYVALLLGVLLVLLLVIFFSYKQHKVRSRLRRLEEQSYDEEASYYSDWLDQNIGVVQTSINIVQYLEQHLQDIMQQMQQEKEARLCTYFLPFFFFLCFLSFLFIYPFPSLYLPFPSLPFTFLSLPFTFLPPFPLTFI